MKSWRLDSRMMPTSRDLSRSERALIRRLGAGRKAAPTASGKINEIELQGTQEPQALLNALQPYLPATEMQKIRAAFTDLTQFPFERHGQAARRYYNGIKDSATLLSLMKLWCWGEEAKRQAMVSEYIRLCAVQVDYMVSKAIQRLPLSKVVCNYSELQSLYTHVTGSDAICQACHQIYFVNRDKGFDKSTIPSDAKYDTYCDFKTKYFYLHMANNCLSVEPYAVLSFGFNLAKAVRNKTSHESISCLSYRTALRSSFRDEAEKPEVALSKIATLLSEVRSIYVLLEPHFEDPDEFRQRNMSYPKLSSPAH